MNFEVIEALSHHLDLEHINKRKTMLTPHRYHVMRGGRGGGKSIFVAKALAIEGYLSAKRILCTREIQKSISESVMAGLWDAVVELGLDSFYTKTKTEIKGANGTVFMFMGLKSNITSVKSIAKIDFVWCEEAENISEESWETLIPSIRADGSRIIVTFNPKNLTDPTYQRFVVNPPEDSIVTKINWSENPFFPDVLDKERVDMERRDPELYLHIWEGEPVSEDALSVINPKWIRAAVDAHIKLGIKPEGKDVIGFDLADTGDNCVTVRRKGAIATEMDVWRGKSDELLKSCAKAYMSAYRDGCHIVYDVCGIGASAAPKFDELNASKSNESGYKPVEYSKFNAGSRDLWNSDNEYMPGVKHKDHFANCKAQAWWLLSDRFRNTYDAINNGTKYKDDELISLSSDIPELESLIIELGTPQRDMDTNGRVIVESKKKLKDRGISSPDRADAFVMAYYPTDNTASATAMSFITRRR